jgi:hypothetical protein
MNVKTSNPEVIRFQNALATWDAAKVLACGSADQFFIEFIVEDDSEGFNLSLEYCRSLAFQHYAEVRDGKTKPCI